MCYSFVYEYRVLVIEKYYTHGKLDNIYKIFTSGIIVEKVTCISGFDFSLQTFFTDR